MISPQGPYTLNLNQARTIEPPGSVNSWSYCVLTNQSAMACQVKLPNGYSQWLQPWAADLFDVSEAGPEEITITPTVATTGATTGALTADWYDVAPPGHYPVALSPQGVTITGTVTADISAGTVDIGTVAGSVATYLDQALLLDDVGIVIGANSSVTVGPFNIPVGILSLAVEIIGATGVGPWIVNIGPDNGTQNGLVLGTTQAIYLNQSGNSGVAVVDIVSNGGSHSVNIAVSGNGLTAEVKIYGYGVPAAQVKPPASYGLVLPPAGLESLVSVSGDHSFSAVLNNSTATIVAAIPATIGLTQYLTAEIDETISITGVGTLGGTLTFYDTLAGSGNPFAFFALTASTNPLNLKVPRFRTANGITASFNVAQALRITGAWRYKPLSLTS